MSISQLRHQPQVGQPAKKVQDSAENRSAETSSESEGNGMVHEGHGPLSRPLLGSRNGIPSPHTNKDNSMARMG